MCITFFFTEKITNPKSALINTNIADMQYQYAMSHINPKNINYRIDFENPIIVYHE